MDYLEKSTLGAGAEVQTVLDAAKAGKVKAEVSRQPDLGAHRLEPVHQVGVWDPDVFWMRIPGLNVQTGGGISAGTLAPVCDQA